MFNTHPDVLLKTYSSRQLRAFDAWQIKQENTLDKTTAHLAQIAAEVRRSRVKNPEQIKLHDMQVKFELRELDADRPEMTLEEATAMAKARWFGLVRNSEHPMPVTVVKADGRN